MADALKKSALEAIDNRAKDLFDLNQRIWNKPELGFQEFYAHSQLVEFFENAGFEVDNTQGGLETAFRASIGSSKEGITVGIMCEYDALPGIGHACGHNLISEAGVGCALGLKAALEASAAPIGRVVILGTPAEEDGGGKVKMIDKGCFDDIDICMMVHPKPLNCVYATCLAREDVTVTFHGHSSHAAAFPWEGRNALDAVVLAYNSISALRQQMKPTWRVHGVVTNGGAKPNIIPDSASMSYYIRTPLENDIKVLHQKVHACFKAAALATGCTADIKWNTTPFYSNLVTNNTLAKLYQTHAESFGLKYPPKSEQVKIPFGSTDMGNVSHIKPAIHPYYDIGTDVANHTAEFAEAAKTKVAHESTLKQAKILAMVAIDVMTNKLVWEEVQQDFRTGEK
ncbi:xaa-Arg dipeptidase [Nematostella vectensis]|uniref:xaa-Arg dipeptidase n=1 Tax=Nematostella vectensis TaxID=45351 RepID=UPI0020771290|nr:xaa-Arg dipeptidase [Nematostella vectensis]